MGAAPPQGLVVYSTAVRTPNWLGDSVMALPAIAALRQAFPDAVLWSHPRVSALFETFLPGIRVVAERRPGRSEFNRVILMTDSFSSAMQAVLSGIPERIGRRGQFRRLLLTRSISPVPLRNRHHSLDYIELAEAAGASGPWTLPAPSVIPSGPVHAALFAGARYGSAKRWGGFAELARRLHDRLGLPLVLYGTMEERGSLHETAAALPSASVETDLGLAALASRLARASLAVGNDSGGVHLASALGVPTVSIFGSTSPVWTAPIGAASVCVSPSTLPDCGPCFRRSCPRAPSPPCLASISVDAVMAACSGLPGLSALEGA
jgi:ADP-heptose:LPS heptosyltransferase